MREIRRGERVIFEEEKNQDFWKIQKEKKKKLDFWKIRKEKKELETGLI